MPDNLKRYTIPSVLLAAVAAFALSACGGNSSEDAASALAKYMPADALVYVEGAVRPDQDVADNVNDIATKLTGTSLSETLDKALDQQDGDSDITYDTDVEPWLGDNAAMYVGGDVLAATDSAALITPASYDPTAVAGVDGSVDQDVGLVAESTDVAASQSFIDKAAGENDATEGEYEGFSYKISPEDSSVLGIVDDNVVFATSEDVFKSMVDASKGENLVSTEAFSAVSGDVADGSLMSMYVANEPILSATQEGTGGVDLSSFYNALGMDMADTGTIVSMVPESDRISIVGTSNLETTIESGDPSELIESFPANSIFATGSGDVGENLTTIMDAINEEGIDGLLRPGDLQKNLNQMSQGLDIADIIESLQDVGFFVSGDSIQNLGGALVATTSDPGPLKTSLGLISSLAAASGDAKITTLKGGVTGFSVRTPELPGRPVVVAIQDDRLVVGIGLRPSLQALSGNGDSLAGSDAYKAAADSLGGENVDMFGDPGAIAALLNGVGDESADQAAEIMNKFEYVVSGSASEDNSFQFNLGLSD
ncbi:MAG: DUF3352 domain-containing protein [Solirubrobacterales bacterium]